MIIPTLGCPSRCSYCWSSDEDSPVMSIETIRDIIEWLRHFRKDRITFTFHGGEPLLAGADFYEQALPLLREELSHLNPEFALQSNLWLMTPRLAEILARYRVPIGSSIDGPQEINDIQRGRGYFEKTMKGYHIAQEHGLSVRFICTFTSGSVRQREEIFRFFLDNHLTMKLHPALPSLRGSDPSRYALEPAQYGELLVFLLDKYLENLGKIEIMNINDLCRGVFTRRGSVCTFVDCMGNTLAVGPDRKIYPCYRFIGMPEFVMGNVATHPPLEELKESPAWKRMEHFREVVDEHCHDCSHIRYCRGGCPYNAMVPGSGEIRGVDPHCVAYKRIFDEISERLNHEMYESPGIDASSWGGSAGNSETPGVMTLIRTVIMR